MIDHILTEINTQITSKVALFNYRIEEDTELIDVEGEKYPAVYKDQDYDRIDLDDDYDLIMYHRITSSPAEPDQDKSFGTKVTYRNEMVGKMVVAEKLRRSKDLVLEIKEAFPHKITPAASPNIRQGIFVTVSGVNWDNDENVENEWGEIDYSLEKDNWRVSVINYNVTTFECLK